MRAQSVLAALLALVFFVVLASWGGSAITPPADVAGVDTNTPTSTPTGTSSPTPSMTSTASPTATPSATPTEFTTQFYYYPRVVREPTFTPSNTPTSTPTATPTATQQQITTGLTGHIQMSKPETYATYIENIKFYELFHNPQDYRIYYGILGVNVRGQQSLPFKTSWSGFGAGGFLYVEPHCWGPSGGVCAPNADAGRAEDSVGPEAGPQYMVTDPGTYTVELWVCYSNAFQCSEQGSVWAHLSSTQFTAIHWTPEPTQSFNVWATAEAAPHADDEVCYLITDDPGGVYLDCSGGETVKSRPGGGQR